MAWVSQGPDGVSGYSLVSEKRRQEAARGLTCFSGESRKEGWLVGAHSVTIFSRDCREVQHIGREQEIVRGCSGQSHSSRVGRMKRCLGQRWSLMLWERKGRRVLSEAMWKSMSKYRYVWKPHYIQGVYPSHKTTAVGFSGNLDTTANLDELI